MGDTLTPLPPQERLAYLAHFQGLSPEEQVRELSFVEKALRLNASPELSSADLDRPALEPVEFDFDQPIPAPDYFVDRLLERCTVNILSGDTGAGKSIIAGALVVAAAQQAEDPDAQWLGRRLFGSRTLVVDEEQPARLVKARLAALGLTNDTKDALRYYSRNGVLLGQDPWTSWLRAEIESHKAELVIVDTAMAATFAEVNNNDDVATLYASLRPIAESTNSTILLLHHERKHQEGKRGDSGQAMMGARQWAGQADTHIALAPHTDLTEEEAGDGDRRRLAREFVMTTPKVRSGEPNVMHKISVTSEKEAETGRLCWMKVEDHGELKPTVEAEELAYEIQALLTEQEKPMSASTIAISLGTQDTNRAFKAALQFARDLQLITYTRNTGLYSEAAAGGLSL